MSTETDSANHRANLKRFRAIQKDLEARNLAVDARFNAQDEILKQIKDGVDHTNGDVGDLKARIAPIEKAYEKALSLWWLFGIIGTGLVTVVGTIVSEIIKAYLFGGK